MPHAVALLALGLLGAPAAQPLPGAGPVLVAPDGRFEPAGHGNGNGNGNVGSNNGNGNQTNGNGNFGTGDGRGNGGRDTPHR
jgi:hypothetical protein